MALTYADPYTAITQGLLRGLEFSRRLHALGEESAYREAQLGLLQERLELERQRLQTYRDAQRWDRSIQILNTGFKLAQREKDAERQAKIIENTVRVASEINPVWSELKTALPKATIPDMKEFLKHVNDIWKAYTNRDFQKIMLLWPAVKEKYAQHFPNAIKTVDQMLSRLTGAYERAVLGGLLPSDQRGVELYGIRYEQKPDIQEQTRINTLLKAGEAYIYKVYGISDVMWQDLQSMPEDERVRAMEEIAGGNAEKIKRASSNFYFLARQMPDRAKDALGVRELADKAIRMADKGIDLWKEVFNIRWKSKSKNEVLNWYRRMRVIDPEGDNLYYSIAKEVLVKRF